jgi:glutaredoxin
VAAFRQSFLWGLAYLFVPFASLIFVFKHWEKARAGFKVAAIGFAGSLLLLACSPALRGLAANAAHLSHPTPTSGNDPVADLSASIQARREQICTLQDQLTKATADATQQYKKLAAKRSALETGDQAAVHQFNLDAAAYKKQTDLLKDIARQIDSDNTQVGELLARRDKARDARASANASQVVIYTTPTCPACKAAKEYMDSKGITYQEVNVEQSPGAEEFQRMGGNAVPVIVVGDKRMVGFNPDALQAML